MKKKRLLGPAVWMLVVGVLSCTVIAHAQDQGYWRAASATATSITGDINIGKGKVTIDLLDFPIAPIKRLTPVEVSSVFDADVNAGINGDIYRLRVPFTQHFQKRNSLCGSEDAKWMVTYVTGHTLRVAFFSGDDMPEFTFDAISKSTALCGTFAYGR